MKITKLGKKRIAKNLSQKQLATKSGISVRTIQDYEQRKRNINLARAIIVKRLAKALGCKMEDLMEAEKKVKKKNKEGKEEKEESRELRLRKKKE